MEQQQEQLEKKIENIDINQEEETKQELQNPEEGEDCYESLEEFFLDSVRLGDEQDVADAVKDGVDVTWFDKNLNNALHMVAGNGHIKMLEIIFKHIDEKKWEQEQINKFLNQQNADGQTALHFGTICAQKEVVQFLVDRGADCNIVNQMKNTPVEEAIALEQYEIGEILAKHTKGDIEDEEYQGGENFQVPVTKEDIEEEEDREERMSNSSTSKN